MWDDLTTNPASFRALENIKELDPISTVHKQPGPLEDNQQQKFIIPLQGFDRLQTWNRDINQRPMEELPLRNVKCCKGEAWQTRGIVVNIYARGTKSQ